MSTTALQEEISRLRQRVAILEAREQQRRQEAAEHAQYATRFEAIFANTPMGIIITDPDGNFIQSNAGLTNILGYTEAEVCCVMSLKQLTHPDDVAPTKRVFTELINGGRQTHTFIKRVRHKDGHYIWTHTTIFANHDDDGQRQHIILMFEDITEHMQATQALKASEERYRLISKLTSDYIYSLNIQPDQEPSLNWVLGAFTHITGYSMLEIANNGGWVSLIHPDDRPQWHEQHLHNIATNEAGHGQYRLITKSGQTRWIRDQWRPQTDPQTGQVTQLLGAVSDITHHHEADVERERLLVELQRQSAIMETTPDFVGMIDMNGHMLYINPAGRQMIGKTDAPIEEIHPADYLPPDALNRLNNEIIPDLLTHDGVWQGSLPVQRADGTRIPTTQAITIIRNEADEPISIGAIVRDVSDFKQMTYQLKQAKERAIAANRAKSAFLASMSHELRTPLNAILGFSQLMSRDRGLTAEQQDNLQIINRSGEHLLALINDVLEMSKIEAGRTSLHLTEFDLHRLFEDMEDMFFLRANGKGLSLLLEREPNVPRYVRADEGKLRQVLINLISNAIKFTDKGGITIRARYHDDNHVHGHHHLHVEVEDTGQGIAPDEIGQLFEAFVQTKSGATSQEGTGLGLAISYQFVKLMGGELSAKSKLGQGSLFKFALDLTPVDAAAVTILQPTRRAIGLQPDQPTYKLLIAEDRLENRKLLVQLLRPFGFEIREAVNGQEAINIWQQWQPDLIWMDIRMPIMDGYQATKHIKATPQGQHTKIVAITASAFEEDRTLILQAGCDDFVRKPFRDEDIITALEKHLGLNFIFDEDNATNIDTPSLAADNITHIPPALLGQLHQATLEADFDAIFTTISHIQTDYPAIATSLAELANNYQYDQLLTLIEDTGVLNAA
ncbi:MAG TPA: PAS domain S-box protein [Anaerolineae bacterium]|nr:PAS domain S-box protein [Anaerolineae bacterium]